MASITECETNSDLLRLVEIFTEINILKLEVPADCTETAIRVFAGAGKWERSVALYDGLRARGHAAAPVTVAAVFSALASGGRAEQAAVLLSELSAGGASLKGLEAPYNTVLRAVARSGDVARACDMMDAALKNETVQLEPDTFNVLAIELMKAGEEGRAEEVLELRDFF